MEDRRKRLKIAIATAKKVKHKTVIGENQTTGEFQVIYTDSIVLNEKLFTKLFKNDLIGIATCSGAKEFNNKTTEGEINFIDL